MQICGVDRVDAVLPFGQQSSWLALTSYLMHTHRQRKGLFLFSPEYIYFKAKEATSEQCIVSSHQSSNEGSTYHELFLPVAQIGPPDLVIPREARGDSWRNNVHVVFHTCTACRRLIEKKVPYIVLLQDRSLSGG